MKVGVDTGGRERREREEGERRERGRREKEEGERKEREGREEGEKRWEDGNL